jgi:hypothetical protein
MFLFLASIPVVSAQTPQWTQGHASEYDVICGLVADELARSGASSVLVQKAEGTVRFTMGDASVLNLYNVFMICLAKESGSWAGIAKDYVAQSISINKEQRDALALLENFERGRGRLFMKIYPVEYIDQLGGQFVGRSDIPGTCSVVVVDMPSSYMPLDPAYLQKWRKVKDEVIAAAEGNTFESLKAMTTGAFDWGSGQTLLYYYDESNVYVASLALNVPLVSGFEGAYGAFLGIPGRSILLIQPIRDAQYVNALALNMMANIKEQFGVASGTISASLFWLYKGKLYLASETAEGAQGRVKLPDALSALLK